MNLPHWARALRANVQRLSHSHHHQARKRRFPVSAAESLEDRTLLAADFGDAPDTGPGTGMGNYNTLLADGGPSHTIVAGLFLGAGVDDETDGLPSAGADGDNVDGALPIDEDGLNHPASDLDLTIGAFPTVSVIVTNTTGSGATLYGWIDANADGVFDNATERASIAVPDGTSGGIVTLTFPQVPVGFTGTTYARFRLSTDAAAADPSGAASDGEVEDYRATIVEGSNGQVASEARIASAVGGFGALNSFARFGESVTSLDDLDGDGVTDMAVGALADSIAGFGQGAVYILFMNADGTVKSSTTIANNTGGLGTVSGNTPSLGSSLAALGDLDGDGITELAVGAIGDDTGGTNRGAVYVLFLNADGTVKASQKIASSTGGLGALANEDRFGFSVGSLGDLDGDGVTDMAVGSERDDTGGADRGAIHVLFLNPDGTVKGTQKIAEGIGGFTGLANNDRFGSSITSLGDLNGDGITELAVGSDFDDTGGENRGAVYVFFMNADGTIQSSRKIADQTGGFGTLSDHDLFGRSLTTMGDLDGNGVIDLAVGAWFDDTGGTSKGAAYVLFLTSDGTVKASRKIADSTGGFGTVVGGFFGSAVANLGDLDGDGRPELAIGASNGDGNNAGAVYVTFLDVGAPTLARIDRHIPADSPTNADQVTFRVAFSEVVNNVDSADFILSGTAAGDGTISSVVATSDPTAWDVTITGLTNSNGTINLDLDASQNIEDLSGNPLTNLIPESEEEYLLDNVPPEVTVLSPPDGFLLAASHTDLVITFDGDVQKGTGNILIKHSSDDSTFQTIDVTDAAVTVSGAMVTINPPLDFADATEYYVQIDAGAFEDLAGNPYAGINDTTTWNFTAIVQVLSLSFTDSAISEAGGPQATTARITRNGDPTAPLVVSITNPDDTELFLPIEVTIPAGDAFVDFDVATVNDGDIDGDQTGLVVTVAADGYVGGGDTIDVLDDDTALDRTLGGRLYGTVSAETYDVLFDIIVVPDRTLVIEAASTLLFAAGTGLIVNGTLTADGAAGSEIVFTSAAGTPAPGDWDGIVIAAPSQTRSVLDHIEVAFGVRGVDVPSTNDPHVTLTNSDIHHNSVDGVRSEARHRDFIVGDDFILDGNQIHDNGDNGLLIVAVGSSNFNGVGSANSMIVTNNEIFNNVDFGVAVFASYAAAGGFVSSVSAAPTIEGNIIRDNGGGIFQSASETPGAFGTGSVGALIRNNLIANNTGNAIEIRRSGSGTSFSTPRVFNNTIVHNGGAGVFHDADILTFSNRGILNNIITGNNTGIEAEAAYAPGAGDVGFNNVFDNAGGDWINYPAAFGNLIGLGATGLPSDAESNVSLDPQFVSAVDFHLQTSSPMVNAGTSANASVPTIDFDGETRTIVDIGFDEVVQVFVVMTDIDINGAGNSNRSGLQTLTLTFNHPVTVAGATSLRLFNHTTSTAIDLSTATLSGNGSTTLTWDLDGMLLEDGQYSAEVPAVATTPKLTQTRAFVFAILSGDLDGDAAVNFNDTVPISLNFGLAGDPYREGDGDGDGLVNFNDTVPLSLNFGASLADLSYDFGDALPNFWTVLEYDGARHIIDGNTLRLGDLRDAEPDGQLSVDATGDGDDEDGVLIDPVVRGTHIAVTVESSGSGFVNGWIDWNQDGDWQDAGEQVLIDVPVVAGTNVLQIAVPSLATLGNTFARFRLTSAAGYSFNKLAPDGEVEDYQWEIIDPVADTAEDSGLATDPEEPFEPISPVVDDESPQDLILAVDDTDEDESSDRLFTLLTPVFTSFDHPLSQFSENSRSRGRGR